MLDLTPTSTPPASSVPEELASSGPDIVRPGVVLGSAVVLFVVLFAIRAVRPVVDTTLVGILVAMVAIAVRALLGRRWAGAAFLAFPVALVVTPAAADLSFSLSADDSTAWRWHAILSLLSAGVASVGALVVVAQRRLPAVQRVAVTGGGVLVGVALVFAVQAVAPTQVFGSDLSAAERAELPRVALVNFDYAPLELSLQEGEVYRAVLVNVSDLPHTLTIDEIGLDLRVPAFREAVVEIDANALRPGVTEFYCSVGDHRELGMDGSVIVDRP